MTATKTILVLNAVALFKLLWGKKGHSVTWHDCQDAECSVSAKAFRVPEGVRLVIPNPFNGEGAPTLDVQGRTDGGYAIVLFEGGQSYGQPGGPGGRFGGIEMLFTSMWEFNSHWTDGAGNAPTFSEFPELTLDELEEAAIDLKGRDALKVAYEHLDNYVAMPHGYRWQENLLSETV